jgi:hypothetical protein
MGIRGGVKMKIIRKTAAHIILLPVYLGLVGVCIMVSPILLIWWAADEVIS